MPAQLSRGSQESQRNYLAC